MLTKCNKLQIIKICWQLQYTYVHCYQCQIHLGIVIDYHKHSDSTSHMDLGKPLQITHWKLQDNRFEPFFTITFACLSISPDLIIFDTTSLVQLARFSILFGRNSTNMLEKL